MAYGPARTDPGPALTDKLAIFLALVVIGFFALDHFVLHLGAPLFLAKEFADLTWWVAFWH